MKRVKLFTLAAALMAMLIVPAVQAQPGGGGRPGGGQFGGRPGGGQFGGRGGGPNNISISQLLQSEKFVMKLKYSTSKFRN